MVQYSTKDLLFATTLVSVGLMVATIAKGFVPDQGLAMGLWNAAGAMIGAGVLLPFKRIMLGACIGGLFALFVWPVLQAVFGI